MREFGSDFHFVDNFNSGRNTINDFYPNHLLFADGRQTIIWLVQKYKWKRLWMPEYFCWEITESIKKHSNVEICTYPDFPMANDRELIAGIPFKKGDALLRMNFFGMRAFRSNKGIPVPVIEDHSHDLIGNWARQSDAVFCMASLRKSLPIAEGGILWSNTENLKGNLNYISENQKLATVRWKAMKSKQEYLISESEEDKLLEKKQCFREAFTSTEDNLDELEISSIDSTTESYLKKFNIIDWYKAKVDNWKILKEKCDSSNFSALVPESHECFPFSFAIVCKDKLLREALRQLLIKNSVYPAVLWNVPKQCSQKIVDLSNKVLSIHCDGRYSTSDIEELIKRIH